MKKEYKNMSEEEIQELLKDIWERDLPKPKRNITLYMWGTEALERFHKYVIDEYGKKYKDEEE